MRTEIIEILQKAYPEYCLKHVDTANEILRLHESNIPSISRVLPTFKDMENKVLDAKRHQTEEPPSFIEGYTLGYRHCYSWVRRIVGLFD